MLTEEQITIIRNILDESGIVKRAWVFGSVARNEEHEGSDIDLMYESVPGVRYGLIKLETVILQLEEALGKKVDLVSESSMQPEVFEDAEVDRIPIFEIKDNGIMEISEKLGLLQGAVEMPRLDDDIPEHVTAKELKAALRRYKKADFDWKKHCKLRCLAEKEDAADHLYKLAKAILKNNGLYGYRDAVVDNMDKDELPNPEYFEV